MDLATIGLFGVLGLVGLAVAFGVLYFVTWVIFGRSEFSEEKTTKAKVVAIHFSPEETHTSIGPVIGPHSSMAVMQSHQDEEDIVLLYSKETGRISINDSELLDNVSQSEEVELTYKEKYTFWSWDTLNKKFDAYVPVKVRVKDGTEITL